MSVDGEFFGAGPTKEKRLGSIGRIVLNMALASVGFVLTFFILANLGLGSEYIPFLVIPLVLFIPLMVYLNARETSLITQNYSPDFARYITEYLDVGERLLCMISGRSHGMKVPLWMGGDIYSGAVFVFTDCRLIIFTFKHSEVRFKSLGQLVRAGKFSVALHSKFSCKYDDSASLQLKTMLPNVLLSIGYSKLEVCPEGEVEPYCWAISNKYTHAGRRATKILTCIEQGGS